MIKRLKPTLEWQLSRKPSVRYHAHFGVDEQIINPCGCRKNGIIHRMDMRK